MARADKKHGKKHGNIPGVKKGSAYVNGSSHRYDTKRDVNGRSVKESSDSSAEDKRGVGGSKAEKQSSAAAKPYSTALYNLRGHNDAARRWVTTSLFPIRRSYGHNGAAFARLVRRYGFE